MKLTDTIKIRCTVTKRDGRKRIETVEMLDEPCKLYGPLALHKDFHAGRVQLWKITHVATGLRVMGEVKLDEAVSIIKQVKDLPEWHDPRLAEGVNAGNKALFDGLVVAIRKAQSAFAYGEAA
jgi:hypothetical protein